jgi:hypothetical protein
VTPAYARLAETHGLEPIDGFRPGPVTTYNVVFARIPESQPLMTLEVDVDVLGHAPRRVRRRLIISDFAAHLMQPGLVLPVYVNPRDPDDILVVW